MAKVYNIKAIVENDDLKLLFECDREKNIECNKKHCDTCSHTTNARYIKANESKEKMLDKRFEMTINNEEYLIEYNSNKEINTIQLNAWLVKLINEKDMYKVVKDNEFKITKSKKTFYGKEFAID